jgi:hypothetical protein
MNNLGLIFCCVLSCLLNSCKVQFSLNGATIPEFAKTVQIDFFENKTTLGPPTMAPLFSETLRDVVSRQTSLKLNKSNGDLVFEGSITDFQIMPVAIQGNDKAAQSRLSITVFVKYTCSKQAQLNFEDRFTRFTDFAATDNFQNKQDELMKEVFRQITEDIFNRAFNNW